MRVFTAFAFACFFLLVNAQAQQPLSATAVSTKPLPSMPDLRTGVLPNGMTYYILKNQKPEKRAELRLVVDAGSLQENDSQQGLAHLVEHMCFNGTKNFPHSELVDFLESSGTRFGPDLNAYTSFDETVYMLQIPTDKPEMIDKGLQVLEDWANEVSFDKEEVEKERGVVVEEWRLGQGADDRMSRKWIPVVYKDSRYANRLPIGKVDVIEKAPYDTLVKFYKDWYRPDLQAIVAVGDFDPAAIEKIIKEKFSSIPKRTDVRKREHYQVPAQPRLNAISVTDKEATYGYLEVQYWQQPENMNSEEGYRRYLTYGLLTSMLTDRLDELRQKAEPPFSYAGSYQRSQSRSNSQFSTYAVGDATKLNEALNAVLTELERMRRFGFTATELQRAKNEVTVNYEKQYNERDKTQSKSLVGEFVSYYLDNQPAPGIAWEYNFVKQKMPSITLDEINKLAQTWVTDGSNCVITMTAPEQKDVAVPGEAQIKSAYASIRNANITAYEDNVVDKPLFDKELNAGTITSTKKLPSVGITQWKLSNGATVIVKSTDFNNDQILFKAVSLGGTSVFDDKDYYDATMAAQLSNRSGIGPFNNVLLQKYLSDKTAKVSISIGEFTEGLDGNSTSKDLETMFQLISLSFTDTRQDPEAFAAFKSSQLAFIQNRLNSPEDVFWDTVQTVLSGYHYRRKPWTPQMVNAISAENMNRIVKDRFSNAGDFTFVFVGSIDTSNLKPYILKYIASLPSNKKMDNYVDRNVRVPKGKVSRKVYKGSEPQSTVFIQYSGEAPFTREAALQASALEQLMRIKLRETLREEMSGVYGVGCNVNLTPLPRQEYKTAVNFGCSPENADKLIAAVHNVIDSVKQHGASEKDMQKVRELMLKGREANIKENNFWMNYIATSVTYKMDVEDVNKYNEQVNALKPVDFKRLANIYFNDANEATFVLYPEAQQKP